jgi:hypothetical protein
VPLLAELRADQEKEVGWKSTRQVGQAAPSEKSTSANGTSAHSTANRGRRSRNGSQG